jgi:hypothetical protein
MAVRDCQLAHKESGADNMMTKTEETARDIVALLRARAPLIWIVTTEEARAERILSAAAKAAKYSLRTWDVASGLLDEAGRLVDASQETQDPGGALQVIRSASSESGLWVLRDFPAWISGPASAVTLRALRNLVRALPTAQPPQSIVLISTSGDVPAELRTNTALIEFPLPERAEIGEILGAAMAPYVDDSRVQQIDGNGTLDAAIDAAVGLTEDEALSCYALSLIRLRRIDPVLVAGEKRRVIARERTLEWHDPVADGLGAVGGLESLKRWLMARAAAFSPKARAYGLPTPKGCAPRRHPRDRQDPDGESGRGGVAMPVDPPGPRRAEIEIRRRKRAEHSQGAEGDRGDRPLRGLA